MEERNEILLATINTLLKKNEFRKITTILNKIHAADVAEIATHLSSENLNKIFEAWDPKHCASVLLEMSLDEQVKIAEELRVSVMTHILEKMPPDDMADFLGAIPEEISESILGSMREEVATRVKQLLKYGKETAGGIMTPEFIALKKDMTAEEAIESLRKTVPEAESIYYVFVINREGQLAGVISLRDLIVSQPKTLIKEVMNPEVIYARAEIDQEEVARIMSKYDLLALPVVDPDQKLLGIVTIDDVVDVIKEEATEDMYRLSGTRDIPESDVMRGKFSAVVRARIPWLMIALGGEVVVVGLIADRFKELISVLPALAVYWAAMTSIGGNTSFQASTVAVRALATGELDPKTVGLRLFREVRLGLLMSIISAVALFLVALVWQRLLALAVIVAVSNVSIVVVGALTGTLAPIILDRLGIDPAVSSSPFLALIMDALSLLLYFSIAVGILGLYPI